MAALLTTLATVGGGAAGGATAVGTAAKIAMVAGTVLSTAGSIQQGKAMNDAAQFNADQMEAQGKADQATATHRAMEEQRQKRIKMSRARAVGAASGGGLDFELMGDIEEEGEYRTLTALWEGEEAAKGRNAQADITRYEGRQAKKAGTIRGGTTLLEGGSSFYEKYG